MEVVQLQKRYSDYVASLFNEGYVGDFFAQLQQIHDASCPGFLAKVISTYFEESEKTLNDIGGTMNQQPIDFKKVDTLVHKLKGSSYSIGAQRVRQACIAYRSSYVEQNTEACMRCAAQVKQEYAIVKEKLQNLFRLEQQIVDAGGAVPVVQLEQQFFMCSIVGGK